MTQLYFLCFGAACFFGLCLLAMLFLSRTSRATLQRVNEVTRQAGSNLRIDQTAKDVSRPFFSAVNSIRNRIGVAESADLPQRLAGAGYTGPFPASVYNASRVLCPLLAFGVGFLIPYYQIFWVIALPALAFSAPKVVLARLIKRRRENVRTGIPDTIDLLVICVDAGLGIDQALLRVGQELEISHPEITEELMQINREQRAGKPRVDAWADMAVRCQLSEMDAFAAMLFQTERFGTPIARDLNRFADNLRLQRRQHSEQMAAKTTVKIVFPLVLCIFPSIFIVLLAPSVISIMRGF
jgi:tight adherence protein C